MLTCPAPAPLTLSAGAAVTGSDLPGETVTPTDAAAGRRCLVASDSLRCR
ncbi:hypothetical protein OG562_03750 [Streptomyces sp. NBC_01275]|nr:hypothetical protein [Streptomyces sp. NBC_01275]